MSSLVPDAASAHACLCENLRRATRTVTRLYDDALRPLELRITQFSLLAHLLRHGEVRVRDLAQSLLLEETTLSRNLRPLSERGLIDLRVGDDRREKLVSITAEGRALMTRAAPLWRAAQAQLKDQVGAGTWEAALRALPKIADSAGTL